MKSQEKPNQNWLGEAEDDIYKENILDHFKNPRNFEKMTACTIKHSENNPLCGDQIEIFLKLQDNKVIDAKFQGHGCAISMASASMLTEKIKGMSLEEIKKLSNEDIFKMLGVKLGVVRMKCGLLSLKTAIKAIESRKK